MKGKKRRAPSTPNGPIMARRWPALWRKLQGAFEQAAASTRPSETPEATLVIDGLHLTSGYDRLGEARLQAELVPETAPRVTVYGFALGDLPRVLLERSDLVSLSVVVLSRRVALASLLEVDHRDWLADSRVTVSLARESALPMAPFAVAPACLRLADRDAAPLRDALVLALAAPYQRGRFLDDAEQVAAQIEGNRDLFTRDADVAELFGTGAGGQAVVVGAGPSLQGELSWLRDNRTEALVIAATRALAPLAAQQIEPDLAIAVDGHPSVAEHVAAWREAAGGQNIDHVPLVYAPVVHRSVLESWSGPRYGAYLTTRRYERISRELARGRLFCAGTVAHAAADLAVQLGCGEVTLLGVDLCYAGGETHAPGVAGPRRDLSSGLDARFTVVDGRGATAPSESVMIGYLRDFETYVRLHPSVRFVKRGRAGAAMEGVAWGH